MLYLQYEQEQLEHSCDLKIVELLNLRYTEVEKVGQWKKENKFTEFINYDKVAEYLDFGGIRIEDDVLVTADG